MRILRILFYLIATFGILLFGFGCTTKKVVSLDRHKLKQLVKAQKDSLFEEKKQVILEAFAWEKSHAFEMEIQSDKDSLGNSKEFSIEKIRSPSSEKIIVRGGSLRFKVGSTDKQFLTKKDTFTTKKASLRTEEIVQQTIDNQIFRKEKEVKPSNWQICLFINLFILILILLFLAWRLKLFRIFSAFK